MAENSAEDIRRRIEQEDDDRSSFIIHLIVFTIINGILWVIWALANSTFAPGAWPWPLVVTLGWGSGLVAHGIELRSKQPGRLAAVDRLTIAQMEDLYGPDWRELDDDAAYQRLHRAAHQRLRHNTELAIHVAVYVMIIAAVWLVWYFALSGLSIVLPLAVTGLWGAGLGAHAASNYFHASRRIVQREKAVQQAINSGFDKKKKRLEHARAILTDDGELLEVVDDPQEARQDGIQK